MLLELYRGATSLGGPLIEAQLRRRAGRGKEDSLRWRERLGAAGMARPEGPLLWLHAASVGESRSLLPLIEALLAQRAALQVLVTTGTVTSAALMREQLPARARHQFAPVDRPQAWRAFFAHWRPQLGVLVESELWPNLILEARAQEPAAGAGQRAHVGALVPPLGAAAGERCAALRRLRALPRAERGRSGAARSARRRAGDHGRQPQIRSAAPCRPIRRRSPGLAAAIGERPVWLAASTHPGEEALVLEAHRRLADRLPDLLTMIAPRASGARRRAWPPTSGAAACGWRSARRDEPLDAGCEVYLADTLGELGLLLPARRHRAGRRLAGAAWRPEPARARPARLPDPARAAHRTISPRSPRGWCRPAPRRRVADGAELRRGAERAAARSRAPRRAWRRKAVAVADEVAMAGDGNPGEARPAARSRPRSRRCERLSSGRRTRCRRACCARSARPTVWRGGCAGGWRGPVRAAVPVICVGNLVAGGAGKTPVALALAAQLIARGRRPHFLTRGYGGRLRGPLRVDPARHDAAAVGDEALLLAEVAPTWCARDRVAGARAAAAAGADLLIMDDGLQNPWLHQDLALLVVDGGFRLRQSAACCPAGPLREPLAAGFARASGGRPAGRRRGRAGRVSCRAGSSACTPRLGAGPDAPDLRDRRVVAFAGIGRPEKFFRSLAEAGAAAARPARLRRSPPLPAARGAGAARRGGGRAMRSASPRPRIGCACRPTFGRRSRFCQ